MPKVALIVFRPPYSFCKPPATPTSSSGTTVDRCVLSWVWPSTDRLTSGPCISQEEALSRTKTGVHAITSMCSQVSAQVHLFFCRCCNLLLYLYLSLIFSSSSLRSSLIAHWDDFFFCVCVCVCVLSLGCLWVSVLHCREDAGVCISRCWGTCDCGCQIGVLFECVLSGYVSQRFSLHMITVNRCSSTKHFLL